MRSPHFTLLAAVLGLAAPSSIVAAPTTFESGETPATLVELFTSEGCSSCPPADAWVSTLKGNPGLWKRIVPVVFHVDYWNSLGWSDRFSSPENTARQRRYVAVWGADSVYTPGMVLNGREWRNWFEHPDLPEPSSAKVGKLTVTLHETQIEVVFAGRGPSPLVEVAFLGGNLESDVTRGENRGHKLRHDFTVLRLLSAPLRAEGASFRAILPVPAKFAIRPTAIAAWVTSGDGQPPIQATGGWLSGG